MGTTSYVDDSGQSPANEFYGGSSTANFMREVKESFTHNMPKDTMRPAGSASLGKVSLVDPSTRTGAMFIPSVSQHLEHLALPTRDLADRLLGIYWSRVHPFSPLIYKPAFDAAFEGLWKSANDLQNSLGDHDLGLGSYGVSDSRSIIFHCALNSVFAIGSQLSGSEFSREERESLSQTFFLRAKKLLYVDLLDHDSIAVVQALLLFAQYMQSAFLRRQYWTAIGLACRIAQGLGLHVEGRGLQRDRRELEVRRRVWYVCISMDM